MGGVLKRGFNGNVCSQRCKGDKSGQAIEYMNKHSKHQRPCCAVTSKDQRGVSPGRRCCCSWRRMEVNATTPQQAAGC